MLVRAARLAECVFCEIVAGRAPANVVAEWGDAIVITPLDPVTPGHLLVIPREHVDDLAEDPKVTGRVMRRAAQWAQILGPCNLITSKGAAATQTVMHLHVHLVPRREGDGLALPWTVSHG